jgi:AGCS family alanine or glycine:cation symporter
MLIFLSIVGVYFTLRLKGLQFTRFLQAGQLTCKYRTGTGEGNITPLQSLLSALGGLIGNGNLAGVATAIAVGGPGAIFWLWISSFIAMIIVCAETYLALINREKSVDGTFSGGPMYYIENLLKLKWLAILFAFVMGTKTLLATATVQSNSISLAAHTVFGVPMIVVCIGLAGLTWLVIIGGLNSIARTLEKLTPFMVIIFALTGLLIILVNSQSFIDVIKLIFSRAFTPAGASGGFAGATVMMAIRYGVARGFYSNEAGTGSSPIMYSTAISDNPKKLSLISMFGVFIDTVVSTLTAFIILITGTWMTGETSTALTTAAFGSFFGSYGGYIVFLASFLFGYSTLIVWCFYGEQCYAYIWGIQIKKFYRWAFCFVIIFGFFEAELIWSWGDLLNAFTVLVNVMVVLFLIQFVVKGFRQNSFDKDG